MPLVTTPVNFNIANADHILQDKDKAKYDSLKARMQSEQQEFLRKLRSKAFADHTRYTGCHKQAADQIEVSPSPIMLQPAAKFVSIQQGPTTSCKALPSKLLAHHFCLAWQQLLPCFHSLPCMSKWLFFSHLHDILQHGGNSIMTTSY